MAIGFSSSFNEPYWDRPDYAVPDRRITANVIEEVLDLLSESDEYIHDNYGQAGRNALDHVIGLIRERFPAE